jgi:ankyrin repeat protein
MLVSKRWLRSGRTAFNFSRNNNEALQWACFHGKLDALEVILEHPRVDPSWENNDALRCAAMNGKKDVVERLLNHPKINPSDVSNQGMHQNY